MPLHEYEPGKYRATGADGCAIAGFGCGAILVGLGIFAVKIVLIVGLVLLGLDIFAGTDFIIN